MTYTPEELDRARAAEAYRIWMEAPIRCPSATETAARLARENWQPPPKVDPDVLAAREWWADRCVTTDAAEAYRRGDNDHKSSMMSFIDGAEQAREAERAKVRAVLDEEAKVWTAGNYSFEEGGLRAIARIREKLECL